MSLINGKSILLFPQCSFRQQNHISFSTSYHPHNLPIMSSRVSSYSQIYRRQLSTFPTFRGRAQREWALTDTLVFRVAEAELVVVVTKEVNARSENQFSTWLSLSTRVSELNLWVDEKVSHNLHQEAIVENRMAGLWAAQWFSGKCWGV